MNSGMAAAKIIVCILGLSMETLSRPRPSFTLPLIQIHHVLSRLPSHKIRLLFVEFVMVPFLPLSLVSVAFASPPTESVATFHIDAKSGVDEERHTLRLTNVALGTLGAAKPTHEDAQGTPPSRCSTEFELAVDGRLSINDSDECSVLTDTMQTWSITTDERLFESVSWTMAVFDMPDGPRLGIPSDLLDRGTRLEPPFISYSDVKVLRPVAPNYPSIAKREGLQAVCRADLRVSKSGRVIQTTVHPDDACVELFHRPAERALKRWQFAPYRIGKKTYESDYSVRLKFKMPPNGPAGRR